MITSEVSGCVEGWRSGTGWGSCGAVLAACAFDMGLPAGRGAYRFVASDALRAAIDDEHQMAAMRGSRV
ncbi:hypothetical protein EU244_030745 [Rhodococcus qingshengii]|uniref:hypothetical protein n=1 Tax=Rhodococcus qingshengii TaxID=334542 RepID=UPI0010A5E54E|nr:hypothetical protein [Rhodococcus qingshengii]THJ65720.1 hypothetical protein EU244_28970 [Rhodococcus qingshengii]